jgi:hypothetical protein
MSGFTPKIPLVPSPTDGFYALTENLRENTKQSLKMIVLTSPGERIMNPLFGVGARQFLFEQFSENMYRTFQSNLTTQVKRYLPIVEIIEVQFFDTNKEEVANSSAEVNVLAIEIKYAITNLNIFDSLFIEDISIGL